MAWALEVIGLQIHARNVLFPLSAPLFALTIAVLLVSFIWGCLAYNRSKLLNAKSKEQHGLTNSLFCPACRAQSSLEAGYCRSCGQSLSELAQALFGPPSRLSQALADQIARAERLFLRMGTRKMAWSALVPLLIALLVFLGQDSKLDGLLYALFYLPTGLLYLQMLMTRRREQAPWNSTKVKENSTIALGWLAGNSHRFEELGVSKASLTAGAGLHAIEETEAILDRLENQEIVVRQADKTAAGGLLVKPGRMWPEARARLESESPRQAPSLAATPTAALNEPPIQTTQPITNSDGVSTPL
ncbi:MAG TPA: hypothetical protein VEZ90_10550 [Blastocatellia bacterium]|nr:hypothetical protein [Blastocatellia bacterium]